MKFFAQCMCGMLLIGLVFSCDNQKGLPESFDYGRVENGVYKNDFFRCKIRLPKDWVVQSQEQSDEMMESGNELLSGDDEDLQKQLKATEINVANMLSVFEVEVGSTLDFNPSMMIVAENVKAASSIKTGADYLKVARKLIERTELNYEISSDEYEKVEISGTDFYKLEAKLAGENGYVTQNYYATISKGFCFLVIVSFDSDEDKETLQKSLNSLMLEED